jgi:hypothetical protein
MPLSDDQRENELKAYFYGTKYCWRKKGKIHIDAAFDSHHTIAFIKILENSKWTVKTAEITVSLSRLKGKSFIFK